VSTRAAGCGRLRSAPRRSGEGHRVGSLARARARVRARQLRHLTGPAVWIQEGLGSVTPRPRAARTQSGAPQGFVSFPAAPGQRPGSQGYGSVTAIEEAAEIADVLASWVFEPRRHFDPHALAIRLSALRNGPLPTVSDALELVRGVACAKRVRHRLGAVAQRLEAWRDEHQRRYGLRPELIAARDAFFEEADRAKSYFRRLVALMQADPRIRTWRDLRNILLEAPVPLELDDEDVEQLRCELVEPSQAENPAAVVEREKLRAVVEYNDSLRRKERPSRQSRPTRARPSPSQVAVDAGNANGEFTVAHLHAMTGLSNTTLNKYAKCAGVKTPGRGGKNFRYPVADVRAILTAICNATSEGKVLAKCKTAMEKL
jgi:hypothetical protein